ncbi:MAG: DUF1905 domain-containing protein [Actinomycetales bacterium]|nr:DUF1905 domain-containing protein [Actinomycetales bacterium]
MLEFTTTLLATGGNNAGIELSQEQLDALGAGKRAPVVVTIGDYTYRTTTGVMRGRFLVGVNAEHRAGARVAAGDEIHVTIARDDAPREVEVPPALADALSADPVAAAAWEKLAYSHRKEHARAITEAKAEETRARRVAATLATLRG